MEFTLNVGIFRKMKSHIVSTEVVIISYVQLNPMFTRIVMMQMCT